MQLKLETRAEPSRLMGWLAPLFAAVLTLIAGFILFSALGRNPVQAFYTFFPRLSGRASYNRLSEIPVQSLGSSTAGFVVTTAPAGTPVTMGISSGPLAFRW